MSLPVIHDQKIVVLGAGIIGCASARVLLEMGYNVTLVAKHIPGDHDIWYALNWAGALWHGARTASAEHRALQSATYRRFLRDNRDDPQCGVCRIDVKEYFQDPPQESDLWFKTVNSDFREIPVTSVNPSEFAYGCQYSSVSIEPPRYLLYVKAQIEALGGKFVRQEISSMDALYSQFPNATVFINASGVGPKYITGLYDENTFPNRGQNVLVRPQKGFESTAVTRAGGAYTYVIPRPLSNVVVCGGINQPNETTPEVNPAIAADEIKRAHELAPEVVAQDPEVVDYVVAIRPGRHGDFRLECQKVDQDKHIVHAYGFNGKGYAFSYGAAEKVGAMVKEIERSIVNTAPEPSI